MDPARRSFGREAEGLAAARLAAEKAEGPDERGPVLDTLAWALFATGRREDALRTSAEALAAVEGSRRTEYEGYLAKLEAAIEATRTQRFARELTELRAALAELEAEVSQRRSYSFADPEDRWWHDQLEKLIDEIRAFADPETGLVSGITAGGWGIRRRLEHARRVEALTVTGAEAARRWRVAIESIADQDECPAYRGLRIAPQLGLLPLGRDPETGLWEFAHVQSGAVPQRDDGGRLSFGEDTCMLFVLLPGGRFTMGSQRNDAGAPNFDPASESDETPVHELRLAPFFVSKFEMTQGQWRRFTGTNPSSYHPGFETNAQPAGFDLSHPVEMVTIARSRLILARLGLQLPTEAQWEYAARGGEGDPWAFGTEPETLDGASNLADQTMRKRGGPQEWDYEDWDDGYALHAPAGSFAANAFGLHDVHGNVWELCRDAFGRYTSPFEEGSGLRLVQAEEGVARGGSFEATAIDARTASRTYILPGETQPTIGVRPVRVLEGR